MALGAKLNKKDSIGRTALHYACKAGNLKTFRILVADDNCDIDAVTNSGVTPLMCAIDSGVIELVVECLNEKVNPFLKDALGRSAIDYANNFPSVQGAKQGVKHNMRKIIE